MWPMRLELSRDECKKCLRCLELEAYGNMVSVLRAQGSFTNEKQKLLQELAKALHISNERHRAEIRRAVNDEKLSTIAEQLNGPNTGTDWAIEGRRTIPLLPRLNACTVFTSLANSLSLATSVANAKRASTSREELANMKVKVETESVREKLRDNGSPVNAPSTQPEDHSINRKRRRSRIEVKPQDVSDIVNRLDDDNTIVKDVVTSFSCIGSEPSSPLPASLSNKVFIVSTSSPPCTPKNNIVDNSAETNAVNSSCSIMSTTSQVTTSHHSGSRCVESNSTGPCQAVVSQNTSYTHTPAQVSNQSLPTVVHTHVTNTTASSKLHVAKVISTPTKLLPKTTTIVIPTSCSSSQHPIRKSTSPEVSDAKITNEGDKGMKLVQLSNCVQKAPRSTSSTSSACVRRITTTTHSSIRPAVVAKPISSPSGPQKLTVGTGISSSGPGPPHTKPTAAVLCKKIPTVKTGHQGTKMGITMNSNKTVNIATSNPGSRVAAKANVIVVQKGQTRGVTLSHAGKEVLGKVIIGGKNLCLSNQQSPSSIALLPHRISANGEQSLAMLSPINSSQAELVKTNAKQSGNMIVFDLRQDSLEKSKSLSEILEASGVFSSESKTAILNTNSHLLMKEQNKDAQTVTYPTSKSPHVKSAGGTISFVMDSKEHRKNREAAANDDTDRVESPAESKIDDLETEISSSSDCMSEIRGTLDPQTGIYSFQAPANNMNNIQTDESISNSTGIDIFSTALASADINLGSFQYIDEHESSTVLDDVRNQILTIDQLNDLYEGHQSISDKSNC